MSARRYKKKKPSGKNPVSPQGKIESIPDRLLGQVWDEIQTRTLGVFITGLRDNTPAGDVISNLTQNSQSAPTTSPAVSLFLSQLEEQSDFKPKTRLEYDKAWSRRRDQVINDYNHLGSLLPPGAKTQALAAAWARGVVSGSFGLAHRSSPDFALKQIAPSMMERIIKDYGKLENFPGWENLGSWWWGDTIEDIWNLVGERIDVIKDTFISAGNVLRDGIGGNLAAAETRLSEIWHKLNEMVGEFWDSVGHPITQVWARIQGFSDSVFPQLGDWIKSLRGYLTGHIDSLKTYVTNAINSFRDNILPALHSMANVIWQEIARLVQKAADGITALEHKFNDLYQTIIDANIQLAERQEQLKKQNQDGWSGKFKQTLLDQVATSLYSYAAEAKEYMKRFIVNAYNSIHNYLKQQAPITPEKVPGIAAGAVGLASGFGLAAHWSSTFFEAAYPLKRLGLHQISAFLSDMASFSSIAAATGGVMAATAIRQPFQYYANDLFRPNVPGDFLLQAMAVKPDINMDDFKKYMAWYGYSDFWIDRIKTTMYNEPRHFELGIMMEDSSPELPWLFLKCRRAGYDPNDAEILSGGLLKKTERMQRQDLYRQAFKLYKEGYISALEFDTAIEPLELREGTHELAKQAADMNYIYDHVSEMISLLTDEFIKEVIDENDLVVGLVALGITPEKVDFLVAKAQIRKLPKPRHTEEAELKRAMALLQKKYIALYTDQFRKEVIQADEFRSNLEQIGLTPEMASVTVQLEITRRLKVPSKEIAKTVTRANKEMIALYDRLYREQFRKGQIDKDTLFKNLFALGYSQQKVSTLVSLEEIRMYEPPDIQAA